MLHMPLESIIKATGTMTVGRTASWTGCASPSLFGSGQRLLLPRGCAGCDEPDAVLCMRCRNAFLDSQRRALPQSSMRFGYACGRYDGVVRQAILRWKDHGDEECTALFALLLEHLAACIGLLQAWTACGILIVPVPSSARSIRQRGRWHMLGLAKKLVALLRRRGMDASVAPVLYMERRAHKAVQSLDPSERAERARDALRCRDVGTRRGAYDIRRRRVVVLDDIVTTGSTMRRCVHLLRARGFTVLTSLALAYTSRQSVR